MPTHCCASPNGADARLYERSDTSSRALEGCLRKLASYAAVSPTGLALQSTWQFQVDIATGHKTGFYLTSATAAKFAQWAARLGVQDVLNCYCYTGGFTVAALMAVRGMSPKCSCPGAGACQCMFSKLGLMPAVGFMDADVSATLRAAPDRLRAAALYAIVLDPPKLAPTAATLARRFKDGNRLGTSAPPAMRVRVRMVVRPYGVIVPDGTQAIGCKEPVLEPEPPWEQALRAGGVVTKPRHGTGHVCVLA